MIISNNIIIRIIYIYIKWYLCNCNACPQCGTYKIMNPLIFFFLKRNHMFTIFLQQILSSKLLLIVIIEAKK